MEVGVYNIYTPNYRERERERERERDFISLCINGSVGKALLHFLQPLMNTERQIVDSQRKDLYFRVRSTPPEEDEEDRREQRGGAGGGRQQQRQNLYQER